MRSFLQTLLFGIVVGAAMASVLYAQARSAPDWTTEAADSQRTSWISVDPYISRESLPNLQFLWKLKVDNESRYGNSLSAPVALGNLMTFRGFKSLIFVGGSSNNVYAIDYDFGTLFWKPQHNYASGPSEYAGSPSGPGGMTLGLTHATNLTPATQLSFFGFARPPRPAKSEIGEPGRGAPQLAEIAARQAAARAAAARGSDAGAGAKPAAAAPAGGAGGTQKTPSPNYVFSVAADGLVRAINPHTGDAAEAPAKLLPANASATGLIWTDGFVYAATSNG